MKSPLNDTVFLEQVTLLLVQDRQFLRQFGSYLKPDDFKPRGKDALGDERWVCSAKALQHYEQYSEPIGELLLPALKDHARVSKYTDDRRKALMRFGRRMVSTPSANHRAIAESIQGFKLASSMASAVEEMLALSEMDDLDTEKFREICQKAVNVDNDVRRSVIDYFEGLEGRIDRRAILNDDKVPAFFIDQLDALVRGIGRKHVGLIAAPWKRGKSLFLLWIALAYALQGLKVLWVTLEDPLDLVEDRLDAATSFVPIDQLREKLKTLRRRHSRYKSLVKGNLQIYDGTDQMVTVQFVEQLIEDGRDNGQIYDAVFIDYDDELVSRNGGKDRRFEFAEIYRDLRKLAAKWDIYLWTAAQTRRDTMAKKLLTGEDLAEDISKARKVSLALGLGVGDWGDESIYVYVMGNKLGKQFVGTNIMTDKGRMCIYDRQATYEMAKRTARDSEDYPAGEDVA